MHEIAAWAPAWLLVVLSVVGALSVAIFAGLVAAAFIATGDAGGERYTLTPLAESIAEDPLEAWYSLGSPVELAELQAAQVWEAQRPPRWMDDVDCLIDGEPQVGFLGEGRGL